MFTSEKILKFLSFNLLDFELDKSVDRLIINQSLLLLTFFGSLTRAFIVFGQQQILDGVINILLLIIAIANILIFRRLKSYILYSVLSILVFYTFMALLFFNLHFIFPADIIWFSLFPPLCIFLISPRKGSLLSGIILFLLLTSFYVHNLIHQEVLLPIDSIISFTSYYIIILLGTLSYGLMYDRVEKSLDKAKKDVKRSRKERKDFISRLSHEMRTPLNDMVVLNSLLEHSNLNENQRNIIETLKASTHNLVNSVQAISEASGSDSRIKQFENVRFDLKKTLEGTIDFYVKKEIGDLTFSFNNDNGPDQVLGDPVILKQILLLFIESFLKSKNIPENLKIDFPVSLTIISNNKAFYQFQLISNFKAFHSETDLANILDLDERQISAEALQEDLQLLNIRMGMHILQSLKGELNVSMEDKLTTLSFTLPFFIPDKSGLMKYGSASIPDFHDISSRSKLSLKEANVLLVEDNELNQKILLIGLKNYINNIDVALNGKEALDKFGTSNYDLILMDIQMQEMDGLTATRKIREIEESTNSHVPIIAVTANALLGDRETCLSAGMDEYISKPFQIEELIELIKKFIKE